MIKNKNIFITGGAGFIGSHLVEKLISENKIVVFDNEHRNALKNTDLISHPNLKYIKGDILEKEKVEEAMKECDTVIHCAAIAGVDTVLKKPITTMQVNFEGTSNVLKSAVKNNLEYFLNFSTSEVYGPMAYKTEESGLTMQGAVGERRWAYAVSKLASEHLTDSYGKEYGISTINIRPFNIYGPRQVGESAMHKFVANSIDGKDLIIHGDGTQIRAWCYIDDFIKGTLMCLESPKAVGKVFNIGNPQGTITTLKLADEIIRISRSKSKKFFKKISSQDIQIRIPSIKKIRDILGFEPKVSLSQGIENTISWYRGIKNKDY